MHARTSASLLLLALLALALGGCAQDHEPPARPRAGMDEEGFLEPVTYLVRGFVLPGDFAEEDPSARAPGFDLDGLVTDWDAPPGGCEQVFVDFDSALDPDERGVDNALAILEPVIDEWIRELGGESLAAELARAVAEGRLLLAIEVSGLHASEDSEARLRVFAVEPADGSLELEAFLDADGAERLRPAAQALRGALLGEAVARAEGGRAVGWFSALPLEVEGAPVPLLPLEGMRSDRAALGLYFEHDGGARGALGGSVTVEAVRENALASGFPEEDVVPTMELLGESFPDVSPSREDPERCERFSLGLGLDLVRVDTILR